MYMGRCIFFFFFQPFTRLFGNSEGSLNPKYCTEARAERSFPPDKKYEKDEELELGLSLCLCVFNLTDFSQRFEASRVYVFVDRSPCVALVFLLILFSVCTPPPPFYSAPHIIPHSAQPTGQSGCSQSKLLLRLLNASIQPFRKAECTVGTT